MADHLDIHFIMNFVPLIFFIEMRVLHHEKNIQKKLIN